jgi:hypothetical protein
MVVDEMRIDAGLRVGYWNPSPGWGKTPFTPKGYYRGPYLGEKVPGELLQQELMEGTLYFRVGVLFRPDLNVRQRLETILILENSIPEMFQYEDWEAA